MDICQFIDDAAKEYAEETNTEEEERERVEYDFKQGCIYILKKLMEMKMTHESIVIEC